ncbi:hypothetical protein [Bacillus suaedaesalsae]|uniref:Uncharacterized protein n=1 Tax=Bacillus suaedaesalsae TaxID=2810349 RepID=A0ABS2DFQ1_9BACI|nr:hypothetical protein [Bacillus suaedaesalsae]MBM6617299.1 hypothetical protein [Bacillus suaedaesalsae]
MQEIEQTLVAVAAQRLLDMRCPFCGDECTVICRKLRGNRRVSVYELLYGQALHHVVNEAKGREETYSYPTMPDLIKKGIALGYLPMKSLEGWNI